MVPLAAKPPAAVKTTSLAINHGVLMMPAQSGADGQGAWPTLPTHKLVQKGFMPPIRVHGIVSVVRPLESYRSKQPVSVVSVSASIAPANNVGMYRNPGAALPCCYSR